MKDLYSFLESGLLEKYVVGDTNDAENNIVENFISEYPEVQSKYELLQDNLEIISKLNAVDAPKDSLNFILNSLDENKVIHFHTHTKRVSIWYSIAASAAAILFATTAAFFFLQNQQLIDENQVVVEEIFDLRSDIENNNSKLESVMKQFMRLNNPETEKYIIRGNRRAKNLKTVAYINPKEKTSMIEVVSLPQLPEEQCYQMWAQLQDKMVNLGILDAANTDLRTIPYTENALGFEITIEPKGGNETATIENSVANIKLQNNN
ncbi:MAG: anti-sigma factor [Flavobacteriaceae bacterium]|nr:anti-sigma factor [Bacteroidia bacterium]NNL16590.1 anti-sigma factor [Flavobacteriaceae bacterium]